MPASTSTEEWAVFRQDRPGQEPERYSALTFTKLQAVAVVEQARALAIAKGEPGLPNPVYAIEVGQKPETRKVRNINRVKSKS